MPDDFAVPSLLLSTAAFAGIEAMKAVGWRVKAFAALATVFAIAGISWPWLKTAHRPMAEFVAEAAATPLPWLLLIALAWHWLSTTGGRKLGQAHPSPAPSPTAIGQGFAAPSTQQVQDSEVRAYLHQLHANLHREFGNHRRMIEATGIRQNEADAQRQQFSEIIKSLRAAQSDLNAREVNQSLFWVLNLQIASMVERLIDDCISKEPVVADVSVAQWNIDFLKQRTEEFNNYLSYVQHMLSTSGSYWPQVHHLPYVLHHAEANAEREAREIATDLPSGINPFDARNYIRGRNQSAGVGAYLRRAKQEQFEAMVPSNITRLKPLLDRFHDRF